MNTDKCICPICNIVVEKTKPLSKYFPFCSERCQKIDLGAWAKEEYRVPIKDGVGGKNLDMLDDDDIEGLDG